MAFLRAATLVYGTSSYGLRERNWDANYDGVNADHSYTCCPVYSLTVAYRHGGLHRCDDFSLIVAHPHGRLVFLGANLTVIIRPTLTALVLKAVSALPALMRSLLESRQRRRINFIAVVRDYEY